jgi:hypothetical protein
MAPDRPHLPARSFARYKDALVPCRFSNDSLTSFCSLPPLSHLPAPPPRASGCRAPLTPLPGPLAPQSRNDAASGKNVPARRLSLIRSTPRQHCLVDRLTRRPLIATPMKRPGFQQVAGDLVTRRPQMLDSCSSPSSFVHQSTTYPHVSTVVD